MRRTVARPVGREENAVVSAVERTDVVVAARLIGDLADDRRVVRAEAGDLVDLPEVVLPPVLLRRRADDHAEERLGAAPVHRRLTHSNGGRPLHARPAEAGRAGEVLGRPIRIADPEIAAARRLLHRRHLVAEGRDDGGEVAWERDLGHEEDGVLDLSGSDHRGEEQRVHLLVLSGAVGKRTCSPSPPGSSDAMMYACASVPIGRDRGPLRRRPTN